MGSKLSNRSINRLLNFAAGDDETSVVSPIAKFDRKRAKTFSLDTFQQPSPREKLAHLSPITLYYGQNSPEAASPTTINGKRFNFITAPSILSPKVSRTMSTVEFSFINSSVFPLSYGDKAVINLSEAGCPSPKEVPIKPAKKAFVPQDKKRLQFQKEAMLVRSTVNLKRVGKAKH